jgi:hypothetical protein
MSFHYQYIRRDLLQYLRDRRREAVKEYPSLEHPPPPNVAGSVLRVELEGRFRPRNVLEAVLFHLEKEGGPLIFLNGGLRIGVLEGQEIIQPIWEEYQAKQKSIEKEARVIAPNALIESGYVKMPILDFIELFRRKAER